MARIEYLQLVQQEGFDKTLNAHSLGRPLPVVCPYTDSDRLDAWVSGCDKAERYVENREHAARAKRQREERVATATEKLEELFGGYDEREAFEEWLAAFIDARTG